MPFDGIAENRVSQHVLTLQVICGTLAAGVITFLVVVLVLRGTADAAVDPGLITYLSIGFFLATMVAALIVPRVLVQAQLAQIARGTWKPPEPLPANYDASSDSATLLMAYQTQFIVRLAMLEGAAFFGLVACLLEGHWLALGVAIAALAILLYQFPTRGRLESWTDQARASIQAIRQWPQPR